VVVCLERCADLHMAQLIPLPLTVSCFSKIPIGFILLVPSHPGSPGQRAVKRVCVCIYKAVCSHLKQMLSPPVSVCHFSYRTYFILCIITSLLALQELLCCGSAGSVSVGSKRTGAGAKVGGGDRPMETSHVHTGHVQRPR